MTNKTTSLKVTTDEPTVEVSDPYSSTGHKMNLRIHGAVVDSGDYTNTIHAYVEGLVKKLNQAGIHIWELNVDKLIPRLDMCECCGRKKGNVKDLAIAFRVENGISGAGVWELMIEDLGWMPIGVWRDNKQPNDVWIYLKKVV